MTATIKDVANLAGVSTATVSRVLSDKKGTYSQQAAQKVLAAAKKLGYVKNVAAAELVSKSSNRIAVILNNTLTNFWTDVIKGIYDAAMEMGYKIFILYAGDKNLPQFHNALDVALERPLAGILMISTMIDQKAKDRLQASGVPFRLVSIYDEKKRLYKDLPYTSSNNVEIATIATRYLIELGHERIGLVGIDRSNTGQQRLFGFEQEMIKHQLPIEPSWIHYGNYSYPTGQNSFADLLNDQLTAVITASDMIAVGMIQQANVSGITLPQQLSILSIDGTYLCDITTPTITSVTQNFYQMGRQSVIGLLNNQPAEFIPVKITERQSTIRI